MSVIPRPGLFAPGEEKKFYEGIQAYFRSNFEEAYKKFGESSAKDSKNISDDFFAGLSATKCGRTAESLPYLERVASSDIELPDKLMEKYIPAQRFGLKLAITITEDVLVEADFDSLGAALLLAEVYQELGRVDDAIGVLQQLVEPTTPSVPLMLSLCELYEKQGDYESIVDTVLNVDNGSDAELACLLFKAKALIKQNIQSGALEILASCLKRTKGRNPDLIKQAHYWRAIALENSGQAKRAKTEFEKLYAEDHHYLDVKERLGIAAN